MSHIFGYFYCTLTDCQCRVSLMLNAASYQELQYRYSGLIDSRAALPLSYATVVCSWPSKTWKDTSWCIWDNSRIRLSLVIGFNSTVSLN